MTPSAELPSAVGERADSRRKRLRLIAAARAVVAERGVDVSAADIAARAEVGVGTLYRRFGSKDALIRDILLDGIAEVQTVAEEALANPDPWEGLATFLAAFSAIQVANQGLAEFTSAKSTIHQDQVRDSTAKLRQLVTKLVSRAHDSGTLRKDVTWKDIVLLTQASVAADECLGIRANAEQSRRTCTILLDGLRAPGTTPLPGQPPTDTFRAAQRGSS
jgi:AcrR family transcriptional regulator